MVLMLMYVHHSHFKKLFNLTYLLVALGKSRRRIYLCKFTFFFNQTLNGHQSFEAQGGLIPPSVSYIFCAPILSGYLYYKGHWRGIFFAKIFVFMSTQEW